MAHNEDERLLSILSIFHYVFGGLAALVACFPVFHLLFGILFMGVAAAGVSENKPEMLVPGAFGLIFVVIAGSMILFGWTFAICVIYAGRCIAKKKKYMFCLVMGGIQCMFFPFGTALGIFTIILLVKDSVKELFDRDDYIPDHFNPQDTV